MKRRHHNIPRNTNTHERPPISVRHETGEVDIDAKTTRHAAKLVKGAYHDEILDLSRAGELFTIVQIDTMERAHGVSLSAESFLYLCELREALIEGYNSRKSKIARFLGNISTTAHAARSFKDAVSEMPEADFERAKHAAGHKLDTRSAQTSDSLVLIELDEYAIAHEQGNSE